MTSFNIVVLLSCTVYVQDYGIWQKDPVERKQIYLQSISKWLKDNCFNLVVVENSGYSFPEYQYDQSSMFEIVSFDSTSFETKAKPKYINSEHLTYSIRYVLEHSNLVRDASHLILITGRYYIPGFKQVLAAMPSDTDVILQSSKWWKGGNRNQIPVADVGKNRTEVFGCKVCHAMDIFRPTLGKPVEMIWWEQATKYPNKYMLPRMPIEPMRQGTGGNLVTEL